MTERSISKALRKTISRLHDRRGRQKLGLVLLEGEKVVQLAIAAGLEIEAVVATSERADLASAYPEAHVATREELAELATTATPPPVIAVARQPRPPGEIAADVRAQGLLALDRVQDPGNLGALLRTARAFAVGAAVLGEGVVDLWSPKVVRGSMGASLCLPVLEVDELAAWLAEQAAQGVAIYLAEAEGGVDPATLPPAPTAPWCLVLGSESHGLSAAVRATPGARSITLPVRGEVGSLGVAAAGAVLLHLLRTDPRIR